MTFNGEAVGAGVGSARATVVAHATPASKNTAFRQFMRLAASTRGGCDVPGSDPGRVSASLTHESARDGFFVTFFTVSSQKQAPGGEAAIQVLEPQ